MVGSSRPGLSEPHDGGTHPQEHRQKRQHVSDAHPASAQDWLWVHGRMPGNSDERPECHRSDQGKSQCCCTTRPPPTRENAESTSGDDQDCDGDQRTRVGDATRISGAPLGVAVENAAARSIRASAEGLGRDDEGRGDTRQRKYAVGPERRTSARERRHRRRLPDDRALVTGYLDDRCGRRDRDAGQRDRPERHVGAVNQRGRRRRGLLARGGPFARRRVDRRAPRAWSEESS